MDKPGFLSLTRTIGQDIICLLPDGRRMRLVINRIYRGSIHIAFQADPDIRIFRGELLRKIDAGAA